MDRKRCSAVRRSCLTRALSYSRHEYFRCLLCNLLGSDGLELGSLGRGVEPAAA